MSTLDVWLLGFVAAGLVSMIGYLFNRQTNTYTKDETTRRIHDVVDPIVNSIEQDREISRADRKENTQEMKALNESITDLRIELARHKDV